MSSLAQRPPDPWTRPALVTLHGINSDGAWQTLLRPVFCPHFRYLPLGYSQYRRLGGTKVLLEPLVLYAYAPLLVVLAVYGRLSVWQVVLMAFVGLLLAYFAGRLRRRLAFREVVRQFDDGIKIGERPHVIAHSFGTFLCGRLMQRPTTHCSRVIFAGSVLACDFPASRLPGNEERPFEEMRNEVGKRDLVVRLAGLVRRLVPDLGDAGVRGFVQDSVHVHGVPDADSGCEECRKAAARPRWCIHNVRLDYFTHNDHFISPKHALMFWLPFLWEIQPKEFREWLELCGVAARTEAPGRLGKAALEAELRLRARTWDWAGGTLEQFVRSDHATASSCLDDPLESLRFFRSLWKVVDRASQLSVNHGEDETLMAHARALEPRIAVHVALGLLVLK